MMSILKSKTRSLTLFTQLEVARSLFSRMKGLLGESSLDQDQALWIDPCNSIHTFFMKFDIDCVFVNRNLEIVDVAKNIKPGRILFPRWSACSVIEMRAGQAEEKGLRKGEQLYVEY